MRLHVAFSALVLMHGSGRFAAAMGTGTTEDVVQAETRPPTSKTPLLEGHHVRRASFAATAVAAATKMDVKASDDKTKRKDAPSFPKQKDLLHHHLDVQGEPTACTTMQGDWISAELTPPTTPGYTCVGVGECQLNGASIQNYAMLFNPASVDDCGTECLYLDNTDHYLGFDKHLEEGGSCVCYFEMGYVPTIGVGYYQDDNDQATGPISGSNGSYKVCYRYEESGNFDAQPSQTQCSSDADCDDGNGCTSDVCIGGTCQFTETCGENEVCLNQQCVSITNQPSHAPSDTPSVSAVPSGAPSVVASNAPSETATFGSSDTVTVVASNAASDAATFISSCEDTSGWVDEAGDNCTWYESITDDAKRRAVCDAVSDSIDMTFTPPNHACCSCATTGCHVSNQDWLGDGYCDETGGYNTVECGYDGGDCCESTCKDGPSFYCGQYGFDCVDPDGMN